MKYISLNIPERTLGKFRVTKSKVEAYSEMVVVSPREAIFSGKKMEKVSFDKEMTFHKLEENQGDDDWGCWASDVPQEQKSQIEYVKHFKGRILIGGLGIGLIATALAQREKTTSIYVVEKEANVEALVWKYLKLDKSGVLSYCIVQDLFEYLKEIKGKIVFNYAFYDIWAPTGEDVLYTHIRPLRALSEGIIKQKNIVCWQEDVMKGQMAMQLTGTIQSLGYKDMSIFSLPEKAFKDFYKRSRTQWPFYNWLRHTKPTTEEATRMMRHYVFTYTDIEKWSDFWEVWDYKAT